LNCVNCNKEIPSHSSFCLYCGVKIEKNNIPYQTEGSKINPNLIMGIAAVVAITIVVFILTSNNQTNESGESANVESVQPENFNQLMSEIKSLKEKISVNPDDVHLNIQLGNHLFDVKNFHDAIPYYKKSLEIDPNNVEARIDMAVSYFNIKNIDTALSEMEKALKIKPNHPQGLFNLGVIYVSQGNKDKAKESWRKLIEQHKNTDIAETATQLLNNL